MKIGKNINRVDCECMFLSEDQKYVWRISPGRMIRLFSSQIFHLLHRVQHMMVA